MEWKQIRKLAKPPHLASLIVVGRSLYAVGGYYDVGHIRHGRDFYVFDSEKNSWKELPSMIHPHDVDYLKLVHLDGFIYVAGGYAVTFRGNVNTVERFDLVEEKWEVLSALPDIRHVLWSDPFIYQGRILISGVGARSLLGHEILQYNNSTNAWQTVLTEYSNNLERVEPALFVHQGNLYRVVYKSSGNYRLHKPVVHVLELNRNGIGLSVGEEVKQDWIPANRVGAFRIQEDVFVNAKGYVQMSDLKIESDQTSDVDLQIWEGFALKWEECSPTGLLQSSNVTCFTFDKKKL